MSTKREIKRAYVALKAAAISCKNSAKAAEKNAKSSKLKKRIRSYISSIDKDIRDYEGNLRALELGTIPPMPPTTEYSCRIPQDRFKKRSLSITKLKEGSKEDAKLKRPRDLTEAELKDLMKARDKAGASDQQAMMDREREWFEHYYGTDPVQFDETGKMVQPRPVRDVPKRSLAIKTKDGKDLEGAIDEIIRILPIKEKPGDDYSTMPVDPIDPKLPKLPGLPDDKVGIMPIVPPGVEKPEAEVIKGLQAGLNMLSNKQNQSPLPNTPKVQKLKEDGIAGPKTAFGLKKALVDQGTGKVSEAVALGQFKETVKKAKKDGPQNLAGELGATFGPLLGKKKAPKQGFQPEGLALQDTLNDLGAGLKDDGIVGPKTTDAFSQIAKTADEDDLVNRFGYNLGFDF